jgi:signal recognition particle subunit SEC65
MLDPSLKNFEQEQLEVICQVIQECVHPDPTQRPSMQEITKTLRQVIDISPEAAYPRLSPLWWAELEILSVEAS